MKPALDEIISRVGKAEFAAACELARRTAPGTGEWGKDSEPMPDFVYYRIIGWIQEAVPTPTERIALLFAIYERLPCYALLSATPDVLADDLPEALLLWRA